MSSTGPSRTQLLSLSTYQSTTPSRLKFLYSDFSGQRQSNPSAFVSNVEWWRRTLEAVVFHGWQSSSDTPDKLVLHAPGPLMAEAYRVEGAGKPLALATVIVSARIFVSAFLG
jgi:charged multivesicular body protein 7